MPLKTCKPAVVNTIFISQTKTKIWKQKDVFEGSQEDRETDNEMQPRDHRVSRQKAQAKCKQNLMVLFLYHFYW